MRVETSENDDGLMSRGKKKEKTRDIQAID